MKKIYVILIILLTAVISLNGLVISNSHIKQQKEGLYANKITVLLSENNLDETLAEGNALIIYNNMRIEADFISYYPETGDISINGNLIFNNEDYQLEAEKMAGNLKEETFTLKGNIKLTGEGLQLLSANLLYSNKELVFRGNTSIIYKDIAAEADNITYTLDDSTALLEGNVQGSRNGYHFSGEKLVIDLSTEKIILSNKAQIIFEDNGEE